MNIEELVALTQKLKILVVEDNQDSREQFVDMLQNLCENITTAVDGEDGLQKFKENSFDLVISDINMPKMNGIEMVSAIRENDSKTSVIVVSAHNEESYLEQAQHLNIDEYIYKPIDLGAFIESMSKIVTKMN